MGFTQDIASAKSQAKLYFHPKQSAFRELEFLSRALAAVFFAFFHAAVAGEVAGVAKFLGHAAGAFTFRLSRRAEAEHGFQSPSHSLTNRARLAGDAAAMNKHGDIEPAAHFRQIQRTSHRVTILDLSEVILQTSAV